MMTRLTGNCTRWGGPRLLATHWQAGVEPWKRLWQTLRSSCEKQWAMTLPQFAVSRWIGHSIEISGKHYTNAVPDELFDQAAGQTGAHHISTHECSRTERIERNRLTPTPREGGLTPDWELQAMEPGGVEPPSAIPQSV